jgi:hypothetical protein
MQLHGYATGMDQVTGLVYGVNVSKWIKDHPEYLLQSGFEGLGFTARRRNELGRAADRPVTALTLDELAVLVDVRRENRDG